MLISDINIEYEKELLFKNFSINFMENKITCILGKSGIGKTTLLNNISNTLLKNNIKFSYIFQDDRLIEWLNVYENLKLVANIYKDKQIIQDKIFEVLEIADLKDAMLLLPNQLSGGMRQRVNIARALIRDDNIILMDEPFKSIDEICKYKIMNYIKSLKQKTIIIVTHSKEEVKFFNCEAYILEGKPVEYAKKLDIARNIN